MSKVQLELFLSSQVQHCPQMMVQFSLRCLPLMLLIIVHLKAQSTPGDGQAKSRAQSQRPWLHSSIRASEFAKNSFNPLRSIVDGLRLEPNPEKEIIDMSLGDPTLYGNLKPHESIIEALHKSLTSMSHNGYVTTVGDVTAREAVADYYNSSLAPLTAQDVILTSGASHALDLCISAIASRGQNILIPRPGFPLYSTLARGYGVDVKYYNLLPDRGWEVDLYDLESQIDTDTAAIILNNPSNPSCSVYSAEHLKGILDIAETYSVSIVADEIYEHFVFKGEEFVPLASLSKNVPILTVSGLTKRYLVPGWRMGWILIYDRQNAFKNEVRGALQTLTGRITGSNTLVQGALPDILHNTPQSFFDDTVAQVQVNAELAFKKLQECPGLYPTKPRGSMYIWVGIDMARYPLFSTESQFTERLGTEESVFCLPGKCFEYPGYFRMVLTVPRDLLEVALGRIRDFCMNHYVSYEKAETGHHELNGTGLQQLSSFHQSFMTTQT